MEVKYVHGHQLIQKALSRELAKSTVNAEAAVTVMLLLELLSEATQNKTE